MQTVQIDKLGTDPFDGTTLLNPAVTPISIQTLPAESRTVITIPDGVAVGQIDLAALLGIPSGNSWVILGLSITGDFVGNFTGGAIEVVGPPNPTGVSRAASATPLAGSPGASVLLARWMLPQYLLGITTIVADTGPYRLVILVEKSPNQKLMASIASGILSQ